MNRQNEAGFIRKIVARPESDEIRLAYADWLELEGRPERAEFMRLQIKCEQTSDEKIRLNLQCRADQLLQANEKSWLPDNKLALFPVWRRGFVVAPNIRCRGVFQGEDSLKVLAKFPLTEELNLTFCMEEEEFQFMPDLPLLRALDIGGNAFIKNLRNETVARIGRWKSLRQLRFQISRTTDSALPHLAGLVDLQELDIAYARVSDDGIVHLARLRSLESLDLSETGITGSGLAPLSQLPRLRKLSLRNTRIWDCGIRNLLGCKNIEELDLHADSLERLYIDSDLLPIANLPKLRDLRIGWSAPTENFLNRLRQRRNASSFLLNGVPLSQI